MIMSQEAALLKAKEEFRKIEESIRQATGHRPAPASVSPDLIEVGGFGPHLSNISEIGPQKAIIGVSWDACYLCMQM
jgi:hypothetical protein